MTFPRHFAAQGKHVFRDGFGRAHFSLFKQCNRQKIARFERGRSARAQSGVTQCHGLLQLLAGLGIQS